MDPEFYLTDKAPNTAVETPPAPPPRRAKSVSKFTLVLLTIMVLLAGFIYGFVNKMRSRSEMVSLMWSLEDTRIRARNIFDENYYRQPEDRARAKKSLEKELENLQEINRKLSRVQKKYGLEDDDNMLRLHYMYVIVLELVDMYIDNSGNREQASLRAVKEGESKLLGGYYEYRNGLAGNLNVPDKAKIEALLRDRDTEPKK
jgi:hypothetical protein